MSSTTLDFEISLERNMSGCDRFLPSLLPKWLYETIDFTLMPGVLDVLETTNCVLAGMQSLFLLGMVMRRSMIEQEECFVC
jgi:hypothetical protein